MQRVAAREQLGRSLGVERLRQGSGLGQLRGDIGRLSANTLGFALLKEMRERCGDDTENLLRRFDEWDRLEAPLDLGPLVS